MWAAGEVGDVDGHEGWSEMCVDSEWVLWGLGDDTSVCMCIHTVCVHDSLIVD